VEAAEKYRLHCLMMENCNYDRFELMALNMVRQGVLGEVLHGEAAYLHDLREVKFSPEGEGLWRRAWATTHNGNLYPTHGLGPVANCMDINRGDRFTSVVSMSSPSRGLQAWQAEHLAPDDPRRQERYVLGDQNVSLIQTARGRTIYLAHNTNNPRPYSRLQVLQGTRGIVSGWPHQVYIEGQSPPHRWEAATSWYERYDHPLWRSERIREMDRGHGGMDFLEDYRLIQCLRRGEPTDVDVYDARAEHPLGGQGREATAGSRLHPRGLAAPGPVADRGRVVPRESATPPAGAPRSPAASLPRHRRGGAVPVAWPAP
jgi:hypothetical protein